MKKYISILALTLCALVSTASAQSKGAEGLTSQPKPTSEASAPKPVSNVSNHNTVLQSHIKSLGFVGKTGRYEIFQAKVRGLDTPNFVQLFAYDSETDTLIATGSAAAPGLGVAIVNGGASVGSAVMFGKSLRPDHESINNNSGSQSSGNSTTATATGGSANASAKGGKGGSASSGSTSTSSAQNANATVNQNINTANGGSSTVTPPANPPGHTPPGHQPGHGQPGHGND